MLRFATLLQKNAEKLKLLTSGQLVEGTVVRKDANNILVDIGGKSEGIISHRELQTESIDLSQFQVGDKIFASVIYPENDQGYAVLSIKKAAQEKDWIQAKEALENGDPLEVTVSDLNRGGLVVSLGSVSGFVPTSQLAAATFAKFREENARTELLGTKIKVKVLEIARRDNRLVVSERAAFERENLEEQRKIFEKFKLDQILSGTVTKTAPFGLFVDIGLGVEGLVHVSEIAWEKVTSPAQIYKIGDKVRVKVIAVEPKDAKLALSIKALKKNPFEDFVASHKIGDKVRGKVVKIVAYGIFVDINAGTDAFIHASEISKPAKIGEELEAKIKEIDIARKKINLKQKS